MNDPISAAYIQRPLEMFQLDGKVAVVTGGTGVLCGTIARGLAGAGATVLVVGRAAAKGKIVVDDIRGAGGTAEFAACDVTQRSAIGDLAEQAIASFGGVDILVNGAGINSATPFLEIDETELDRILTTNFKSVVLACQVFGRHLVQRAQDKGKGASIINIGSASGLTPLSRVFTYGASKAAVHNLSANLAREWAPLGIRVNTLVPGFFPAEQNRKVLTPDRVESVMRHTPFGRFGEPQELLGAAILLASDAGAFITGTEMIVDGGFSNCTI